MSEMCKLKTKEVDGVKLVKVDLLISQGKLIALVNALDTHGTPVSQDLRNMLRNACENDSFLRPLAG